MSRKKKDAAIVTSGIIGTGIGIYVAIPAIAAIAAAAAATGVLSLIFTGPKTPAGKESA